MTDPSEQYQRGIKTRRAVLGDAHVERAVNATDDFDAPFQRLITEGAWGSVWSRPQLSHRERSMLTIALLAAHGHLDEVAMHIRAAQNTGASMGDVREVMLHVAIYAGVPAANAAIARAKKTYAELAAEKKGKSK